MSPLRTHALQTGCVALLTVFAPLLLPAPPASAARTAQPTKILQRTAVLTVATYQYADTTNPEQSLDAYYVPAATHRPWIVVVHGGSWAAGNRKSIDASARKFEAAGFHVFNVEYRKISDFPGRVGVSWATQRNDVIMAVDWVRGHADAFGIDRERGAIYGFSAGGHLAASVGLYGRGNSRFKAIVSTSGVLQPQRLADVADSDPRVGHAGDKPTADVRTLSRWAAAAMRCPRLEWADCKARWNAFMPEQSISTDDPQVMMFQGTADQAVPPQTARAFAYWLRRKSVPYVLTECVNWSHTEACAMDGSWRQDMMMSWLKARTAAPTQ
ncbi:MAG: alpha/beta hydrolase [Propionibacteriaceae bacterium]